MIMVIMMMTMINDHGDDHDDDHGNYHDEDHGVHDDGHGNCDGSPP